MNEMPLTLGDAIATQPAWLQGWVMLLVLTHLAAVFFIVTRQASKWQVRYEPMAILASFFVSAMFMGWLYEQAGYVRLLGLAHLVFWTPAFVWVLVRRKVIGTDTVFGKYVVVYLAIAGTSLVIDTIDVVRYLVGDGAL